MRIPQPIGSYAMIEYIFFDAELRDKFVKHAKLSDVPCVEIDDALGLVVAIPEELPEAVADEMEAYYDTLENEQATLSKEEGDLKRLAGFHFKLPDGQTRMFPVQMEMASRLLASFSLEEIQALFDAVADCTLNPKGEHLCKILAAQDQKTIDECTRPIV
jgi:hypothetical protein